MAAHTGPAQGLRRSTRYQRLIDGGMPPKSKQYERVPPFYYERERQPFARGGEADLFRGGIAINGESPAQYNLVLKRRPNNNRELRIIAKEKAGREALYREWKAESTKIRQVGVHPRIVRCLDSLIDKESWNFYLVFPKADCDLHTFIGANPNGIPPDILKKQMKGILQGLRQIHMQKIIHRDITPGNILIPDLRKPGLIKITDFGLAESLRSESLRYQPNQLIDVEETCGTPGFIAPEACYWANGQPVIPKLPAISYGYKVDCWSAGAVMLTMMGPGMSLTSTRMASLDRMVITGSIGAKLLMIEQNIHGHANPPFTGDLVQLLSALINHNPNLRSPARDALQMPYFQ